MIRQPLDAHEVLYIPDLSSEKILMEELWVILKEVDSEFIPPLSSRAGPRDVAFKDSPKPSHADEPICYFSELLKQRTIIARVNGHLAGFLSYRENYLVPEIKEARAAYVSTIAVSKSNRGQGLARILYKRLMEQVLQSPTGPYSISTRTWSTNKPHIKLVLDLGFFLAASVENGRGQGINTVIYALDL